MEYPLYDRSGVEEDDPTPIASANLASTVAPPVQPSQPPKEVLTEIEPSVAAAAATAATAGLASTHLTEVTFLDVLPDLLTLIVLHLPPPAAFALAETCHALRNVAASDDVWKIMLRRHFPDSGEALEEALLMDRFYKLAYSRAVPCATCGMTLLVDGRRCPCVALRTRLGGRGWGSARDLRPLYGSS